jgi:hypothetical protein
MPLPTVTGAQITSEHRRELARVVIDFAKGARASPMTMRECVHDFSISPEFKMRWLRRIDDAEITGQAMWPWFQTAWARAIRAEWDISSRDSRSEVPFETAHQYFYPSAGIDDWWKIQPLWRVKELAKEGNAGLVSGERGYGKTDHALELCYLLIQLKLDQIANGPNSVFAHIRKARSREVRAEARDASEGSAPQTGTSAFSSKLGLWDSVSIQFPTNISISSHSRLASYFLPAAKMSEFVTLMCEGAKANKFSLVVPDEMGFSFNKKRAMTIHNFAIEQLLILIRKFNAGLLAIAQSTENQLPASLTASAQTRVQKLSKGTAMYDVQGYMVSGHLKNVPAVDKKDIDFQTRAFAPFGVDIVPSLLVDFVNRKEREAREAEEEWTDAMMYDAAIAFCRQERASDEEIAAGKSGVLRSEVRYYAQQIDPTTNKLYTAERIARELEVEADKVKAILGEQKKAADASNARKHRRAGYSGAVTGATTPSTDGGSDGGSDGDD